MEITLQKEKESCLYNWQIEKNIVEKIEVDKDYQYLIDTTSNKIIVVTEGSVEVCFDNTKPCFIQEAEMFYVGLGVHLRVTSKTNAVFYIFRLRVKMELCNCFPLVKLTHYLERNKDVKELVENSTQLYVLPVLPEILASLILLKTFIDSKLNCNYFFDIKINELLFAIGKLYDHKQQALFFKDLISSDMSFSEQIKENALKYKTVSELAESMNYTISGFEKRFKRTFNTTPRQWIKQKKAEKIYYDLTMTDICLKEIIDNHGFKSDSYFNEFCKTHFGISPGKIRKNRGLKE